jgi:hypothetical protein
VIAPRTNKRGNATERIPATRRPTRIKGKNITVNKILKIPQEALREITNNLPKIQIIKITINTVNTSYPPYIIYNYIDLPFFQLRGLILVPCKV